MLRKELQISEIVNVSLKRESVFDGQIHELRQRKLFDKTLIHSNRHFSGLRSLLSVFNGEFKKQLVQPKSSSTKRS